MRKLTRFMSLILVLSMILGMCVVTSAAGDEETAEEDTSPKYTNDWVLKHDDNTGTNYWELETVYVKNPTIGKESADAEASEIQIIRIDAPEAYMKEEDGAVVVNKAGAVVSSTGLVYTAENAPIMLYNTSGGYSSSQLLDVTVTTANMTPIDSIIEGYVFVSIQTRGKATINDDGEYIGQFPGLITDMKAGIRFLRYYDSEIPGDSESIVSRGFSSGGAVSAMLGASGDSPVFDDYLEEIGAYDTSDVIFITLASAPITNLDSADASYEWFQTANETYFLFNNMAYDREGNNISDVMPVGRTNFYPLGSNILGGAHEDELSAWMYDWYVDYVQSLGLDLGDDGRSGEFYQGFVEIYEEALEEYIARFDELADTTTYATVEDYLATLGTDWFTYDAETGDVEISSLDDMVANYSGLARKKMCPSLDSYNYRSNENAAFISADGTLSHFDVTVYEGLMALLEQYEEDPSSFTGMIDEETGETAEFSESDYEYLAVLAEDYESAGSEENEYMLSVMSPINYITDSENFGGTSSKYWRLRVGSADSDHGAPAAWLIAEALEEYQPDVNVSVGIAWDMGHSLSELTEQDLYDYIAEAMEAEGRAYEYYEFVCDNVTTITDESLNDLFDAESAAAGVEALADAGKIFVNGFMVPTEEDDSIAFEVNGFVSFYKDGDVWTQSVHKATSSGGTFLEARKGFIDGLSLMAGLTVAITLNENGKAEQIDFTIKETVAVYELIDNGDGTYSIDRSDFQLGYKPGMPDINDAVFDAENIDEAINEGDLAFYWYDTEGWHLERAVSVAGNLSEGQDHGYYIFNDEYYVDCNITKYNLATANRPGQFLEARRTLGILGQFEVTAWFTPTGYPFGYTGGDNAKAALEAGLANAKAERETIVVSADGSDVLPENLWMTAEDLAAFDEQIAAAEAILQDETAENLDVDRAIYQLAIALDNAEAGNYVEGTLFNDVNPEIVSDAVYNAVEWAVENNITYGYTDGSGNFGIGDNVQRQQAIIFLWRLAGRPAVDTSTTVLFNDVDQIASGAYKPVQWAVANGIAKGYSDGSGNFGPEDDCTREQIAILFWRLAGEPEADISVLSQFSDADQISNSTAQKALAWAVENGIIKGFTTDEKAGTVGPTESCLREQFVIMMMRYAEM